MPYRYSNQPPPFKLLISRSSSQEPKSRIKGDKSLLIVTPPSAGPRIISLSSSFRFSPARYFAYIDKKSALWLIRDNSASGGETWPGEDDIFSFPLFESRDLEGVVCAGATGIRGLVQGRKIEAHRSYSLQSKKDFASRNF